MFSKLTLFSLLAANCLSFTQSSSSSQPNPLRTSRQSQVSPSEDAVFQASCLGCPSDTQLVFANQDSLLRAIELDDRAAVESLLNLGLVENCKCPILQDADIIDAFQFACRLGHTSIARLIKDSTNVVVNFKSLIKKRTALHIAAQFGSLELVQLVLDMGFDVDAVDSEGASPIWYTLDDPELFKFFLSLSRLDSLKRGKSLLLALIERNDYELAILLLDRFNIVINACVEGTCPLLLAVEKNAPIDFIRKILSHRELNRQIKDHRGWNALHFACHAQNGDLVELLISCHVDVLAQTHDGQTPQDFLDANQVKLTSTLEHAKKLREAINNTASLNIACQLDENSGLFGFPQDVVHLIGMNMFAIASATPIAVLAEHDRSRDARLAVVTAIKEAILADHTSLHMLIFPAYRPRVFEALDALDLDIESELWKDRVHATLGQLDDLNDLEDTNFFIPSFVIQQLIRLLEIADNGSVPSEDDLVWGFI